MTEKTKTFSKRSQLDFGTVLLIAGASVNIPRWMGVFIPDTSELGRWMHQVLLPVLDAVAGALMGLVAAGAVMYVFHSLGNTQRVTERTRQGKDGKEKKTVKHNERWYITAFLGAGILLISVYILEPYAKAVMPEFVRANVGDVTVWSYLAVLASELIIAAVAMTDKNAAGFASSKVEQQAGTQEQPVKVSEQTLVPAAPPQSTSLPPSAAPQSTPEQTLSEWLTAHATDYQCKEQGCTFDAVHEAQANGRSSKWESPEQAQESLRKMLSGHQVKHKKQAPIPVDVGSVFGK